MNVIETLGVMMKMVWSEVFGFTIRISGVPSFTILDLFLTNLIIVMLLDLSMSYIWGRDVQ